METLLAAMGWMQLVRREEVSASRRCPSHGDRGHETDGGRDLRLRFRFRFRSKFRFYNYSLALTPTLHQYIYLLRGRDPRQRSIPILDNGASPVYFQHSPRSSPAAWSAIPF